MIAALLFVKNASNALQHSMSDTLEGSDGLEVVLLMKLGTLVGAILRAVIVVVSYPAFWQLYSCLFVNGVSS